MKERERKKKREGEDKGEDEEMGEGYLRGSPHPCGCWQRAAREKMLETLAEAEAWGNVY